MENKQLINVFIEIPPYDRRKGEKHKVNKRDLSAFISFCVKNRISIAMALDCLFTAFDASDDIKQTVLDCYKANKCAAEAVRKNKE